MGSHPLERTDAVLAAAHLRSAVIVAPSGERARIADKSLPAGLIASVDPIPDPQAMEDPRVLAGRYRSTLRFRLHLLHYPPYREVKRLVAEDHLSRPICLRLPVRRGKGTEIPEGLDPLQWILEHEPGFLALSGWPMGATLKFHARQAKRGGKEAPGSAEIMWKYAGHHQFGYLQLDSCPGHPLRLVGILRSLGFARESALVSGLLQHRDHFV